MRTLGAGLLRLKWGSRFGERELGDTQKQILLRKGKFGEWKK